MVWSLSRDKISPPFYNVWKSFYFRNQGGVDECNSEESHRGGGGVGLLFVVWNKATSIIMTTVVIILETEKMVLQGI